MVIGRRSQSRVGEMHRKKTFSAISARYEASGDSNNKNGNYSHPVEIYFGREFPAICYHCGVLAD